MIFLNSNVDGKFYLVRNGSNSQEASDILARINNNIKILSEYLFKNLDKFPEFKENIVLLHSKLDDSKIMENSINEKFTSYSVNKGEQLVFCLRPRGDNNKLYNLNLLMYVVLHEMAHVACPEYDDHGHEFKRVFTFLTQQAIKLNIYTKINFSKNPVEYCGLTITNSII